MDWLVSLSIKSKRSVVRQIDYERFSVLGAKPKNTIGNIKLDVEFGSAPSHSEKASQLKKLGFEYSDSESDRPFILIGASTWPGEETLLLKAQKHCIDSGIPCQLIIVPRHVERREVKFKDF